MRNVSDKSCTEYQSTHFVFNAFSFLFFFENHAFNEIMWKNFTDPDRPQAAILRMRTACWIKKATTHTQHTYCFSTATMVARTRFNVTPRVHCLSWHNRV